jgi:hypothetical protein
MFNPEKNGISMSQLLIGLVVAGADIVVYILDLLLDNTN